MNTFSIPQMRDFVPQRLRPWILVVFVLVFQFSGGVYLASVAEMVGSTQLLQEDIQMAGYASLVGMALFFGMMFRLKMAVKSKPTLLLCCSVILLANIICANTTSVPLLVATCFVSGFFRIWGTFECNSTIQLWITPKRDMSVFFCYVYLIVNSTINLSGIMSVYLAFWQTWEYMHYAIVLALLLVMLTTLIIYNDKRVMPPLPLYGIDWLGMLMWGVVGLCVVFVCTYGEHYDWFDSFHIRFATFLGVITFILNRWRASFIHHSYIFHDLFSRYPMVLMLIGIIVLGDTLLAPEHIFEHALMEGILGYDSLNVISLNWVGFLGTLLGCLVVYVLFARWKWPYQRMLMIAFLCYIFYLAYFYFVIDYNLPKEALFLPIIMRTVGYVIMATAVLTANTSLPFPFYFCQAVCVQNLFSAALAGCIGSAIVGRMLRVVQKMNFTELCAGIDHLSPLPRQGWEAAYGMTQAQALLESMKEIYGILLLVAIGAWLFAALFHPAIRPTRYLHPLFTTIRSSLSMDMLKKMRAEKRTEME